MRIFLDMDEVIADFVGGACKSWGVERAKVESHWPIGEWDIVAPMGVALRRIPPVPTFTQEEFWSRIDTIEHWSNKPILPWARDIVDMVDTPYLRILSAPAENRIASYVGKMSWLHQHFPTLKNRFILCGEKWMFARPDAVLIDDRESNIHSFISHGGKGILFPAYHNSNHKYRHDPVKYVEVELGKIIYESNSK